MRTFPKVYSQRDPKWASQRLGTVNGTTIGSDGCYVTSFAMVASYHLKDINPAKLDDWFTNGHCYYNAQGNHKDPANLCSDNMLQVVFGDILYQKTYDFKTTPADLQLLKKLLADPTLSVILCVDFDHNPNDGIQTHFLVAGDCDGEKVKVVDPWYGTIEDFTAHYGNNPKVTIQKFVVYKGPVPVLVVPPTFDEPQPVRPVDVIPAPEIAQPTAPIVPPTQTSTPVEQPTAPQGATPTVEVVVTTDEKKTETQVTTTPQPAPVAPKKKHVDYFADFLVALFSYLKNKKLW